MDTIGLNSNRIVSFLNSLSYWESINLRVTLLKVNGKKLLNEDTYK